MNTQQSYATQASHDGSGETDGEVTVGSPTSPRTSSARGFVELPSVVGQWLPATR